MLNLDPAKLLVILMVALIVLGPERLPKVARQLAAVWREFARIRDQVTAEMRDAIPDVDLPKIPSPSGAISSLLGSTLAPSPRSVPARPAAASSEHTPPLVVVHPGFEDVAFLPDDPSMN